MLSRRQAAKKNVNIFGPLIVVDSGARRHAIFPDFPLAKPQNLCIQSPQSALECIRVPERSRRENHNGHHRTFSPWRAEVRQ